MYSVLILEEKNKWKYFQNPNGSQYDAETLAEVQDKVKDIAKTKALNEITVVKNCTITESITVVESGSEEPETTEGNQD